MCAQGACALLFLSPKNTIQNQHIAIKRRFRDTHSYRAIFFCCFNQRQKISMKFNECKIDAIKSEAGTYLLNLKLAAFVMEDIAFYIKIAAVLLMKLLQISDSIGYL